MNLDVLYKVLTPIRSSWSKLSIPAGPLPHGRSVSMTRPAHRILCVDSSQRRLHDLTDLLRKAGFDVCTAVGESDAVCLAVALDIDVLVMDQAFWLAGTDIWNCLSESKPHLPILI